MLQYHTEQIDDHIYNKAAISTAHRASFVVIFCILHLNPAGELEL